jgi:membrane protease YdiL (CAAX protease family)
MAFTFGIYFGLVYLKTNNLLACIFMHAIFDFLLAVMELFENTNAPSTYALLLPAIILVFEAVGELGLSYFIFKKTD